MKTLNRYPLILISALLAMGESAYGQQPPDVVTSDSYYNTAMGDYALSSISAGFNGGGNTNTAAGWGTLHSDTTGSTNDASGFAALYNNTTGYNNTALGALALNGNTTGYNNTAVGDYALDENGTGYNNTALGYWALYSNIAGRGNTAVGYYSLVSNTTGNENTASGNSALKNNTTGSRNTASGFYALVFNTTANDNNAMGYVAMYSNTIGTLNNAVGNFSLFYNTTGNNNNAVGYAALYHNTTGSNNNAQGFYALQSNTTGSNNIAIGAYAGYNVVTGSSSIYIGNRGVAGENAVIRIGSSASAAYIAGISSAKVTGSAVYVTSSGQLGVLASSERYKTSIASMGGNSAKLQQLRPVTFKLKSDTQGTRQYGLIAEEVDKIYPELVIRDASGKIQGVRYDELAPMLLNEMQQQAEEIRNLKQQQKQFATQAEVKDLKQQLQAALLKLHAKDELVAQR
jgi:trimeric autotransporter adhesin